MRCGSHTRHASFRVRSQASKLGLLSKLEAAGLTLKDVEKLLPLGERAPDE